MQNFVEIYRVLDKIRKDKLTSFTPCKKGLKKSATSYLYHGWLSNIPYGNGTTLYICSMQYCVQSTFNSPNTVGNKKFMSIS